MSSTVHAYDANSRRVRVMLWCMLFGLAGLAGWMWRLQVAHADRYTDSIYRQTVRRVRLPGPRGRIFDSRGVTLAENRPSYCVVLHVEDFRRRGHWDRTVDAVYAAVTNLAEVVEKAPEIGREDIVRHIRQRLPLPLAVWRDVDRAAMARLAEHRARFPAAAITAEPVRRYPRGSSLAHVLGHVRKADPRNQGETWPPRDEHGDYHFYVPEMEGVRGVEAVHNDPLAGRAGGRIMRVDATGYERRLDFDDVTMPSRRPEAGKDFYLAIDLRVQQVLEGALAASEGAAAVALDPRSGDVLALVSAPSFDPNDFSGGISVARWAQMRDDPRKPLLNRAVSGIYAPGSVFKPVVAVAALQGRVVTEDQVYQCPGFYRMGNTMLRCWIYRYHRGHGPLAMRRAFEQSCNTYFCELGVACGYEPIFHTAEALGLGLRTGIRLDAEKAGSLPRLRDVRSLGDLCNLSIGQGALAVTPLQMAVLCAAFANGGRVWRPRLVVREVDPQTGAETVHAPELVRDLGWAPATARVVRQGMEDVVMLDSGTGKRAAVAGMRIAGKTGTAEYGPRDARRNHAWMIAFAPVENPTIALALVLDDAVSGGLSVAPLVQQVFSSIFFPERPVETPPEQEAEG